MCSFKSLRNPKKCWYCVCISCPSRKNIGGYSISIPPLIYRSALVIPPVRSPIRSLWCSWAHAKKKMSMYFITGLDRWVNTQMWTEKQRKARKPWALLCRLTQNVFVPHQHRLVDFCLSEPAGLLGGEEHFHGHLLATPLSHPDFPVATFPNLFHHLNLLSYSPLDLLNPRTLLVDSQHYKFVSSFFFFSSREETMTTSKIVFLLYRQIICIYLLVSAALF